MWLSCNITKMFWFSLQSHQWVLSIAMAVVTILINFSNKCNKEWDSSIVTSRAGYPLLPNISLYCCTVYSVASVVQSIQVMKLHMGLRLLYTVMLSKIFHVYSKNNTANGSPNSGLCISFLLFGTACCHRSCYLINVTLNTCVKTNWEKRRLRHVSKANWTPLIT